MGTKIRIPPGKFQVHDTTEVGNGWKLYTYEPGTAFGTNKATYKDKDGVDEHANPIVFDARGEKDIWWDGLYDIKLTDANDNTIWTMEDVGQGAFEGEARTGPQAITHNMASDADYTLTASQEAYGRIIITDTLTNLTTGRNIICSTDEKGYYFQNDTAQTLTLKTSAGTGIAVPPSTRRLLLCDGTNVVEATDEQFADIHYGTAGGTADALTLSATPKVLSLADHTICIVEATAANETTTPTFAPDGQTAKTITKNGNQALLPRDIYGAGHRLILQRDAGNDVWELLNPAVIRIDKETSVDATNGGANDLTEIDFTGLPSYAERVTVIFDEVSLTGTDDLLVRIGESGGFATSGYTASSAQAVSGSATETANSTTGFIVDLSTTSLTFTGLMIMERLTGNTWVASHFGKTSTGRVVVGGGRRALGGTLDRVRILATGSNTFDGGNINVTVE